MKIAPGETRGNHPRHDSAALKGRRDNPAHKPRTPFNPTPMHPTPSPSRHDLTPTHTADRIQSHAASKSPKTPPENRVSDGAPADRRYTPPLPPPANTQC